jgi:hypothetical protein
MFDTMRKLLSASTPEKISQIIHAAPNTIEKMSRSGKLLFVSCFLFIFLFDLVRFGEPAAEESVFARLEHTRAALEAALGEDVFLQSYHLLRTLQEIEVCVLVINGCDVWRLLFCVCL